MKDRELDLYGILFGGCVMALPFFLCPAGNNWRALLPFLGAFCLYEVSTRKRSILLYLLTAVILGALIPQAGRDWAEKACLLGGTVLGILGYFYGRCKGEPAFFGGPGYTALVLPAVIYVVAYVEEYDYMKVRSCVFAVAVFFLSLLNRNREELLLYVKENEKLHRFPGKRLEKKNRKTMVGFCVILALVMALGYLGAPEDPAFKELPPAEMPELSMENTFREEENGMDMSAFLGDEDEEEKEPPRWLTVLGDILYWVVTVALCVGLAALLVYGIYRLVFGYRSRYSKRAREEISIDEDVMENLAPPKFSVPKLFRRKTPAEQIRRAYKKWVLGGPGQTPGAACTPMEAEREAMVQDEELHALYEKIRYSQKECTQEELNRIRRKAT